MKKIVMGILAHVDAGKTTLSEGMLYLNGRIQKMGRVDNQDAYLDTHDLERERGITIFSKQAILKIDDTEIILLDTPGHVDFSAEMERTLQVLDYAILVISGSDGVQGHTKTLWRLLEMYEIPTFIFINKMDQAGTDKVALLEALKMGLSEGCIEFASDQLDHFLEQLAMCNEGMMNSYLETGKVELSQIKRAINDRLVFPCYFGSALKLTGVEQFMEGIIKYFTIKSYQEDFGARIYKVSRDEQGNRLTHLKLTGGTLKVKDSLTNGDWEEKVNQIRIYSGSKFETVDEIKAGLVCAVTGLSQARPGEKLGNEINSHKPILEPVLSYRVILPEGYDPRMMLPKLRELEEEQPELRIVWNEQLQEIQAQIMGEVQIEILQSLVKDRFDVDIDFDEGRIMYKETITNTVEGVGHFEPLRHYAEVHLLLEPGELGSGLQFAVDCSEDLLSKNWQRLIMSHLQEKTHIGVLTGSEITDLKITLVSGKTHNQHTEGGDFREATYRAVRQGLKEAKSVLLEPYYTFQLEVPENMIGKAMTDIERMQGTCEISETNAEMAILVGQAPVVTMQNYYREAIAYTRGLGRLFYNIAGYRLCHNTDQVIAELGYDSERDVENPTGSIFCERGAGFYVKWDQVKEYMHLESYLKQKKDTQEYVIDNQFRSNNKWNDLDEIDYALLESTVSNNRGKKTRWKKRNSVPANSQQGTMKNREGYVIKEDYLLVDGYNIIHAWPDLQKFVDGDMDVARMKLLDSLANYQAIKKCQTIVVFDAYRVQGHPEEMFDYHNIRVVFTKEAQTADQYIERFAHDNRQKYNIVVATSDGLQQIITRVAGSDLLSAGELREEIKRVQKDAHQSYLDKQGINNTSLKQSLTLVTKEQIESLKKQEDPKQK